ncbi:hypothetical protein MJ565_03250 [Klebsiella pneumoniae]|nr:hypothetical protein MJ565_03250 [Klebsiella pneumoniae]
MTLLKREGHVVGFMGDSISDAPALRAADIGISVDGAVVIAREGGGYHSAGEEPDGTGGGGNRRPPHLRQHAQVHQNDRQLQLRQRLQRAGVALPSYRFCRCCRCTLLIQNLLYDVSQVAIPFQ